MWKKLLFPLDVIFFSLESDTQISAQKPIFLFLWLLSFVNTLCKRLFIDLLCLFLFSLFLLDAINFVRHRFRNGGNSQWTSLLNKRQTLLIFDVYFSHLNFLCFSSKFPKLCSHNLITLQYLVSFLSLYLSYNPWQTLYIRNLQISQRKVGTIYIGAFMYHEAQWSNG